MNIDDLLRARYPDSTHALVFEVRDAAGFSAGHSCDALAIGTWPSRGLALSGFEIKVSRADWLKEYRNPSKADAFARFCDEWWLVASNSKIVEPDELPKTWGLLVVDGQRLKCAKAAPALTPVPLTRSFLAAFLKKAKQQGAGKKEIEDAVTKALERQKSQSVGDAERVQREFDQLKKKCAEFADASGINLDERYDYNSGQKIGEAVRLVLNGQNKPYEHQTQYLLRSARDLVAILERMATSEVSA